MGISRFRFARFRRLDGEGKSDPASSFKENKSASKRTDSRDVIPDGLMPVGRDLSGNAGISIEIESNSFAIQVRW
jgi:hypothetical protein